MQWHDYYFKNSFEQSLGINGMKTLVNQYHKTTE